MIPKFRAWYKKTKEILEVESIDFVNETLFLRRESEFSMSWVELNFNDVVLMQSTGLKDKNGKEIYEGDIVKHRRYIYEVKYDTFRGGWYPFATDDGCGCCSDEVADAEISEVIGNIHEHPELLEGDGD
ncbi:YopX family protein [Macrococcus armenti]|uniref:YopX family protein n=1 Tax=Macrococcus armenti TaxID=2875764 RepID=UPI001CCC5FB8|nr:YopX family protein [Macrococcus armenti]UBH07864.1 YopX family protein [Macrococcus armenti]